MQAQSKGELEASVRKLVVAAAAGLWVCAALLRDMRDLHAASVAMNAHHQQEISGNECTSPTGDQWQ
eukprot:363377-Chlamydomonas_euryale.AAC.4